MNGGKLYGEWSGLVTEQLDDGANLAITTAYRTVLSEIGTARPGIPNVGKTCPTFEGVAPLGIFR